MTRTYDKLSFQHNRLGFRFCGVADARGKPKKYFARDLLATWLDFQRLGVALPNLKLEFRDGR